MSSTISLYGITSALRQLLEFRRDVLSDPDRTPAEINELIEQTDQEIEKYIMAELGKVDAVAVVLRDLDELAVTRRQIANAEYERLKALAVRAEEDAGRLREAVIRAMEIGGKKRIEGRTNIFRVQRNPPGVEISQPDLVPEEFQRITLQFPVPLWRELWAAVAEDTPFGSRSRQVVKAIAEQVPDKREIMKTNILKILKPLGALQADLVEVERAIMEAERLQADGVKEVLANLEERRVELARKIAAQPGVPGARIRQTVRLVVE